jgi:hypothetical protein
MDFTFSLHAAWYTSTNFSTNGNQVVALTRNCANKFIIALIGVNRAEKLRFSQHIPLQCLYTRSIHFTNARCNQSFEKSEGT